MTERFVNAIFLCNIRAERTVVPTEQMSLPKCQMLKRALPKWHFDFNTFVVANMSLREFQLNKHAVNELMDFLAKCNSIRSGDLVENTAIFLISIRLNFSWHSDYHFEYIRIVLKITLQM